mmetsp:Transcript_16814/g.46333  ORF Transcript_16814/g.46333 Transcript_16814/m.46333 type:complete len:136 (-) Transcript_16814:81-488(-)|eukprot:CAMPEP_0179122214 /NCGR_PEP_ID=MMETSP0796-20121207/57674_1 /TAXON_ID=73915 /ORGANISM="Pyrodinium bahamense, Strain pbaha01" /LENGTH=135 /DNA_ID=CAMNT_0020820837 /DNA_START=47 /DNA_END=454 /DNA_ORIENTATION=+
MAVSTGSASLFGDVQSFLQNAIEEAEALKQLVQQNDEAKRAELEELRREVEKERFERRDAMNKIRYEFEEFVHKKINKIFEEVEQFKNVEDEDDEQQQVEITNIIKDMNRFKTGLVSVQESWRKLVGSLTRDPLS